MGTLTDRHGKTHIALVLGLAAWCLANLHPGQLLATTTGLND
jgi:hypothetical protein